MARDHALRKYRWILSASYRRSSDANVMRRSYPADMATLFALFAVPPTVDSA